MPKKQQCFFNLEIGWYEAFLRRHPILSVRTSKLVTSASANISEHNIKKWFDDMHDYLLEDILVEIVMIKKIIL